MSTPSADNQNSPLARRRRSWGVRLTMPLLILIVAGFLLLWSMQHEEQQIEELQLLVRQLCRDVITEPGPGQNSVAVDLRASPSLVNQLASVLENQPEDLPGVSIDVEIGDAPQPYGDGSATHRVYVVVDGRRRMGLRFHHPGRIEDVTLLGFWMPRDGRG